MGDNASFGEGLSIGKVQPGPPSEPQVRDDRPALAPEELAGLAIKFRTQGFYFPSTDDWKALLDEYGLEVVRKRK